MSGTATVAQPAVRRKVKLTYWNWADNPTHQKISLDSVDMFNKSQNFIEVEVDATMAVMESRKKLVVAFAAGGAPDVIMTVQYWVQDYFDNGILHPIERLVQQMGRQVRTSSPTWSSRCAPSRGSRCSICRRPAFRITCSIAPTG